MQTLQKSSFPEKSLLFTLVSFSELENEYAILQSLKSNEMMREVPISAVLVT